MMSAFVRYGTITPILNSFPGSRPASAFEREQMYSKVKSAEYTLYGRYLKFLLIVFVYKN